MSSEVQIALIVAGATLLAALLPALLSWRASVRAAREERLRILRAERKEAYVGFLSATETLIATVGNCMRSSTEPSWYLPGPRSPELAEAERAMQQAQQGLIEANTTLRLMGSAEVDRAGHPVARLTNPPAVWQEPELTRTHRWGRRQYQEWFEALKAARHGFRVAARHDLGFDEDL